MRPHNRNQSLPLHGSQPCLQDNYPPPAPFNLWMAVSLSNNGTELSWDPPAKVRPTAASEHMAWLHSLTQVVVLLGTKCDLEWPLILSRNLGFYSLGEYGCGDQCLGCKGVSYASGQVVPTHAVLSIGDMDLQRPTSLILLFTEQQRSCSVRLACPLFKLLLIDLTSRGWPPAHRC